jgi:hypothetical protein
MDLITLRVNFDDADEKLRQQIAKGETIRARTVSSRMELESSKAGIL